MVTKVWLAQGCPAPRQIVLEGLTNPVLQREDPAGGKHAPDLRQHRQRLVDDVQHR
jgi:hypothetical protein